MTKRIISIIIVLMMLIAAVSCGGNNDVVGENTTDSTANGVPTDAVTEAADPFTYEGSYKVGYAIADITPEGDIPLNTGDMLTAVKEKLYATCIAINAGGETVLLYSLDIKNASPDFNKSAKSKIRQAVGIMPENIMINTMHNHSAPSTNTPAGNIAVTKWTQSLLGTIGTLAKEAVADLSEARPYIGRGETQDLSFVRRYIHEDGSFSSIHYAGASSTPIVAHETEADEEVQVIRFVREDKKDVVMANWQSHVAHAIGTFPNAISGDYVYHARKTVEGLDDDVLFAFFLGAAGNQNQTVRVNDKGQATRVYRNTGNLLGQEIVRILENNMTPVNGGNADGSELTHQAPLRPSSADEVERAMKVRNSGYAEDSAEYKALLIELGLKSKYEINSIINRKDYAGKQSPMIIGAISIGDISFVSVPYEMFDTNGKEIKAATPDKMTFILAYTGGAGGYVPSANSVPNGGYEVYTSQYEYGTGEAVVKKLLGLLKALDDKG